MIAVKTAKAELPYPVDAIIFCSILEVLTLVSIDTMNQYKKLQIETQCGKCMRKWDVCICLQGLYHTLQIFVL